MKLCLAMLTLALSTSAVAGPLQLDPNYGYKGSAIYGFDRVVDGYDPLSVALPDPSGRVWVAGTVQVGTGALRNQWGVLWLTPRGYPDFNFSQEGAYVYPLPLPFEQGNFRPFSAAFDAQGRFLIAGVAQPDATTPTNGFVHVCRMTAGGAYDSSFGVNGCTKLFFDVASPYEVPYKIAVQSDGRILVAGSSVDANTNAQRAAVARLDDHGSYDKSFGPAAPNGGSRILSFPNTTPGAVASDIIVTADGGSMVVASVYVPDINPAAIGMTKLTATGALDSGFSGDGIAIVRYADAQMTQYTSGVTRTMQLPGGDYLVGGYAKMGGSVDLAAIARIGNTGSLDTTFGENGSRLFAYNDVSTSNWVSAMTLDAQGRLVVTGQAKRDIDANHAAYDAGVARLSTQGVFDPEFGSDGRYSFVADADATDPTSSSFPNSLRIEGDFLFIAGSLFPKGLPGKDANYFVSRIDTGLIFADGFGD